MRCTLFSEGTAAGIWPLSSVDAGAFVFFADHVWQQALSHLAEHLR